MKNIHIILLGLGIMISCGTESYDAYGDEISSDITHSYSTIFQEIENDPSIEKIATLQGKIIETCSVKGCWMKVKMNEDTLMVRFKDYGFFVPKSGQVGKNVIIKGMASMETLSVKMLKHYAEDAGKSPEEIEKINEPQTSINFLAEGVLISK